MPSPRSGNPAPVVSPAEPTLALDADDASPGAVEQVKTYQRSRGSGKYGAVQTQPYKPPETEQQKAKKTSWIEIVLIDKSENPVPGAHYQIKLPDGSVADGTLDSHGFARVDGIDPGQCRITFPEYAPSSWQKA